MEKHNAKLFMHLETCSGKQGPLVNLTNVLPFPRPEIEKTGAFLSADKV